MTTKLMVLFNGEYQPIVDVNRRADSAKEEYLRRKEINNAYLAGRDEEIQRVRRIQRRRKVAARRVAMWVISRVAIMTVIIMTVVAIFGKINSMPKQIDAPEGYEKVQTVYTIQEGDAIDSIVRNLITKEERETFYRFQDLKKEILLTNNIGDEDEIYAGDELKVPMIQEVN